MTTSAPQHPTAELPLVVRDAELPFDDLGKVQHGATHRFVFKVPCAVGLHHPVVGAIDFFSKVLQNVNVSITNQHSLAGTATAAGRQCHGDA